MNKRALYWFMMMNNKIPELTFIDRLILMLFDCVLYEELLRITPER